MLSVGIIGFGSIGRDLAGYIQKGVAGDVRLEVVLVRDRWKVASLFPSISFEESPERFFGMGLDVVVEAAGHQAVEQYAIRSLQNRSDFLTVSVGAFCDEVLYQQTVEAARRFRRRLIVPSGAVGGLDRIAAGALGSVDKVILTTRKPPEAWRDTVVEEQIDLEHVDKPACVFEGPAREAARRFPENINVSAAVSLAGIGLDRTWVRVFVDPEIRQNVHEIFIRGSFGQMELTLNNTPSDNPKTGRIVAMSIAKVLKNLSSSVMIGL